MIHYDGIDVYLVTEYDRITSAISNFFYSNYFQVFCDIGLEFLKVSEGKEIKISNQFTVKYAFIFIWLRVTYF